MVREQSWPLRDPQETHPSVLLEVGIQASAQLQILKWYCKLASAPPSQDPGAVLPAQRSTWRLIVSAPRDRPTNLESKCIVLRSPVNQLQSHLAQVQENSCLSRGSLGPLLPCKDAAGSQLSATQNRAFTRTSPLAY